MPRSATWLFCACALLLTPRFAHAQADAFTGVSTTTISSPDSDVAVDSYSSIVSLLDVDVDGEVLDIDVTIDLEHFRPSNIDMYLVAPSGQTVTLTTDNGGSANDALSPVTFDDDAAPCPDAVDPAPACHVRSVSFVSDESIGRVQPEGALGALVGANVRGPWALVVANDGGGEGGVLRSWSLALATMSGIPAPADPASFAWTVPLAVPDSDETGLDLPVTVSGLTGPVIDVDVDVRLPHPRAQDVELYLTSPSGTRIELATDLGNDTDGIYQAATFDDDAAEPASDVVLPEDGSPFAYDTIVPEGALGAFLGEDPNGDWVLTVIDDASNNEGTLERWALRLETVGRCGNAILESGEECDDGNGGNGDGCDEDCRPSACGNGFVGIDEDCDDGNTDDGDGCSSVCRLPERACDDCADNDGNGLADAADPNCRDAELTLKRAKLSKKGRLVVKASGQPGVTIDPQAMTIVVSDAAGVPVCAAFPVPEARGTRLVSETTVGGATFTMTLRQGKRTTLIVKGIDLADTSLDKRSAGVGVRAGGIRLGGGRRAKKKR